VTGLCEAARTWLSAAFASGMHGFRELRRLFLMRLLGLAIQPRLADTG